MSLLNTLKPFVDAACRQRYEEAVALEMVSVVSSKKKVPKVRLLLLTRPIAGHAATRSAGGVMSILGVQQGDLRGQVRQTFPLDRLMSIAHDGRLEVTFNFGASGMMSVSFESHIQQEMFVAAVRRLQNEMKGGGLNTETRGVFGSMHGMGALYDGGEPLAAAMMFSHQPRSDGHRGFARADIKELLSYMGNACFDDVRSFQEALSCRQKEAELGSLETLIHASQTWDAVRQRVAGLVYSIDEMEKRIRTYSGHLLSKKVIVDTIEHENNTLQRKQRNLKHLYDTMSQLKTQLSLDECTIALLDKLRAEPDERLVHFFSEGDNAKVMSMAMKHMQVVLHNSSLHADYPIAAVADRRAYFLEQRRMIANRSRSYIMATLSEFEGMYLSDKTRYSKDDRLVWKLHSELREKMISISDIIQALSRIDVEGFMSILCKYRASMMKVYTVEIHTFLKHLGRQLRTANSGKDFLFGCTSMGEDIAQSCVGSKQAGESFHTLPDSTSQMVHTAYDGHSHGSLGSMSISGEMSEPRHQLSITFPEPPFPGINLYTDHQYLRQLHIKAPPRHMIKGITTSLNGGFLRPDLGFAIALESAITVVLWEEDILSRCFGITEQTPSFTQQTVPHKGSDGQVQHSRGPSCASAAHKYTSPCDTMNAGSCEQVRESLLELFGCANCVTPVAGGCGGLGLPPRPPARIPGAARTPRSASQASMIPDDGAWTTSDHTSTLVVGGLNAVQRCYLVQEMVRLAQLLSDRCDGIYAIPALCMIKAYQRRDGSIRQSTFCQALLSQLEPVVSGALARFLAKQAACIAQCKRRYPGKPTALLQCFSDMPAFITHMESLHSLLAPDVSSCTECASVTMHFVDQSFDVLDCITHIQGTTDGGKATCGHLGDALMQVAATLLTGIRTDTTSLTHGYIQQYRHNAFFCFMYDSLPPHHYATELLVDRYQTCKRKRNYYRELYLLRVFLVPEFPLFGSFVVTAEDLSRVYTTEELQHHRSLTVDAVRNVVEHLERELRSGVKSSAKRMKMHLLRDVVPNSSDAVFHQTLLQRTWRYFGDMLLLRVDFIGSMLQWPAYKDLKMPVTHSEVTDLLASY